ncbi:MULTISPECIES: hypothetical protein [unclassified Streptomyces]|uniref:hypothetical protein n=1 Tax=unclassified Streptomyces TaxID=2593676 RepID=UPI0035E01EE3
MTTGRGPVPLTPGETARALRREYVAVLLARTTRRVPLTEEEATALRAHWDMEVAEANQLDKVRRGLDRHRQEQQQRLAAADAAIVEAEHERDEARANEQSALRLAERAKHRAMVNARYADRYRNAWRSARDRARHEQAIGKHAQQRARAARATLTSIRNAHTMVDIWAHLGMFFGLTPEQAGQEARARRTSAERLAYGHAQEHLAALLTKATELVPIRQQRDAARKHANALVVTLARERKHARKDRQRLDTARRRARAAEATLADIRTLKTADPRHPVYAIVTGLTGAALDPDDAHARIRAYWLAITHQEPTP